MKSIARGSHSLDSDLYSTHLLEDILNTHEQWHSVPQIVPLTFKAVADLLNVHAQALKDLKALLTTRASKTQLTTGLSLKSNVSDISKTVDQLSQAIDQRPTTTQLNSMLRQYASKVELTQILAIIEENKSVGKSHKNEQNIEISVLKARMDEFQRQLVKKVGACVTLTEFNEMSALLESKANISEVNEALEQKVSKQYMTTALQKKVNKAQLETQLTKKADTADLEYIISSLESKVSVTTLQKLTQVLDNKVDKSQLTIITNQRNMHNRSQMKAQEQEFNDRLQQIKNHYNLEIKELKAEFQIMSKQYQGIINSFKKEVEADINKNIAFIDSDHAKRFSSLKMEIADQIDSMRHPFKAMQEQAASRNKQISLLAAQLSQRKRQEESIYQEIDQLRKKFEQFAWKALQKQQFIDFKSEITQIMENKIETQEVQAGFNKFEASINMRIAADRTQHTQQFKDFKDQLCANADTVASQVQQLRRLINKKQDRAEIGSGQQAMRKIRKEVDECRKTVDVIYNEIHSKLSVKEYETDLIEIRKRFESMAKEVSLKASIKDVCVLSDSKPNIDDVNNALKEINQALADKVTEADLQAMIKDQAHINQTLSIENIVGRWMWLSGQLKPGNLLPWETQTANTVPDHFFWEKDKTSILIIAAGIYQITACVFGKSATLHLLANGELVGQPKNQQNVNTLNKKPRRSKEKQMSSTSLRQYLILGPRSRLSVSVGGDASQGFLNVRRL